MTYAARRPLLLPLVPLYQLGLVLHELGLRSGIEPIRRLNWPVISIGNLSTGGSGKTPLTIALAKALTTRGVRVDVLSRGYGRRGLAPARVHPHGDAATFGDEPLLIARETGVAVYVAPERYQAGLLAESEQPAASSSALHLLDDGFQHRQLHRDIDIVLLSRADLADRLLPAGNLREALYAAQRADIIAIPQEEPELEAQITARGWQAEIWRLHRHMDVPPVSGPVGAFCGIARPEKFFEGLERAGAKLAARFAFRDHHFYTQGDLDRMASEARKAGATALLTTEKDRARLGSLAASMSATFPVQIVTLRIEIEDENTAINWLIGALTKLTE